MDDEDEAEHVAQHRELALLLTASMEAGVGDDTDWCRGMHRHLAEMHGIAAATDPAYVHRTLHSGDPDLPPDATEPPG
jgi:hypothetical protein